MRKWMYQLTVMLTVCLGWSACSNDIGQGNDIPDKGCVLTVDAQKEGQQLTRGLTDGLVAIWSEDDVVTVMKGGSKIGTMVPLTTGTASTKLTAKLDGSVAVGDVLTLLFPRSERSYTGQVGTLADIASKYDYATADVTVSYADGTKATATDAHFKNQQAIVKFKLMDGTSPLNVASLIISADGLLQNATTTGDITITPAAATSEIYAALSGINGTVSLTAATASGQYTYATSAAKEFKDGSYYTITVKMKRDIDPMLGNPLALEATEDDTQVTFTNHATGKVQFSRNLSDWVDIAAGGSRSITVQKGEKLYFRGDNSSYYPDSEASTVSCSAPCYVYGNIMSLISSTGFETLTSLPEGSDNAFRGLFEGNTHLRNHSEKELLLPATTLQANCYQRMFAGCTGLTKAPMLPAASLRRYCYQSMFEGCSNLAYIKCLATEISAQNCTENWVSGVKASGVFVKAPAMAGWTNGDNGIPTGWTVK